MFNALNGTNYTNPDDLQIYTLDDVFYMNMKNDVYCIIDNRMALMEHQSTWNPNMPFRGFRYAGELYNKYVVENDLDLNRRKLITMVCKKLTKKKSLSQIADELEEDIKENL